ncbi:MAG: effector binding domain-containing protein [Acidobacteria bacterium]|nr:effector binding domain-containing protein [Acidobacteriota bacterium]MBI3487555.1 effector binding domain-containing protein [Acidobacteriota bacterium]
MEPTPVQLEPFTVSGLGLRTRNAAEADPSTARIPGLWDRFMAEGLAERLGGSSPAVHGVYTAYESDQHGSYQVLAGVKVERPVPGFDSIDIPPGRYLRFDGRGPLPQAIIETWARVWSHFEKPGAPGRRFLADFETYGPGEAVSIHVSIH